MLNSIFNFLAPKIGEAQITKMFTSLLEKELLSIAKSKGAESTLERALSLPQADIEKICAETGADVTIALSLRDAGAQAEATFITYLATGQGVDAVAGTA